MDFYFLSVCYLALCNFFDSNYVGKDLKKIIVQKSKIV